MTTLIKKTAVEVVSHLRNGAISPLECLDELEQRISSVNPVVNALPTLCFERARMNARQLLERPLEERGHLAGLPVPIKDLINVAGVRCTQGSLIFADHIPEFSDIAVTHLERNGAIVYAMSNTPEFGAGGNTFNEVFGPTLNPWNIHRSAAGSSGGAAVAVATGMAWVAQGSDTGGSLRTPASFCGVVGMRPSPGRVPGTIKSKVDSTLGVKGPMARNVEDLALLFDAMVGEEVGDPLSRSGVISYQTAVSSGWVPKRIAVSRDLGITPTNPEISDRIMHAAKQLEDVGVVVEEAHPELREAHECFQVLRALSFATNLGPLLAEHRNRLKPEVIWNIEKGLSLSGRDIARAEAQRSAMFTRMLSFLDTYDLLFCPASIVAAFPISERFLRECNGVSFQNYVEWLAIAYAITNICCPAVSIPAGFTAEGLPIGLQIVGKPHGEANLLAGAKLVESILGFSAITPIDPRTP